MIEDKLISLYMALDVFSQTGWVPMFSDDKNLFMVQAPSQRLYSSGAFNNPLVKKEILDKEERDAKQYLKTLIDYKELIDFLPENKYSIVIDKVENKTMYKLIVNSNIQND